MDGRNGGRTELRQQLEENPDWEPDLLALYGFDIWDAIEGRVPVRQAVSLIGRLNYEPRSIWRAKQLGGPELQNYSRYIGWDTNTGVLADLIDTVNQLSMTVVSLVAEGQDKLPEVPSYPRPGTDVKPNEQPQETLDDFGAKLRMMFPMNT